MRSLAKLLATCFCLGYIPVAPGTFGGGLLGVGIYLLIAQNNFINLAVTLAVTVIAIWSSGQAETLFGKKDDQRIVIDETAGMLVAMLWLPDTSLLYLGLGFAVFRVMDIVKPLGIRKLHDLKGGWGIVADDIAAGLVTNIILRIVMRIT
ncbi:MAG: phosphatidylglycerophosphatase A [bacterium]|nr:phosphatidylglycerophosphatase A [bacterium]MDD5354202.1 phosphatidylglycerophosphatase A [bacterium]MDD5756637.1 phosphatidylglycerophosphatase A [bacterium]